MSFWCLNRAVSVTGGQRTSVQAVVWVQLSGVGCQELGSLALLGKEVGRGRREPQRSQPGGQPMTVPELGAKIMGAEVVY